MSKKNIITGLDIGSHNIKMVSAIRDQNNFETIKLTEAVSAEVRKGVVVDVSKVANLVEKMILKTEKKIDQKLDSLYLSINGSHLSCFFSPGVVSVSRADQKISQADKQRVLENCKILPLKSNQNKIIDIFPRGFTVDRENAVKDPVGLQGSRLEAEIMAVCGFSPYVENSVKTVLNNGLDVNQCLPAPIASAKAVLTAEDKEAGVLAIDVGASTTGIAVYEEGKLVHTKVFPIGSRNITYDIAIYFKIDVETAEKIKVEFGDLLSAKSKKIKVEGKEGEVSFSKAELKKVIEARIFEILKLIKRELKSIEKDSLLPAGVVLTGGGSKMSGLKELTKKELKLATRVGYPSYFGDEDPSFSNVYGLILRGMEEKVEEETFFSKILKIIKRVIKVFIP